MSGASSVSRSSRLTKLRVTPSTSAISAADRYLPSSNILFHRCARQGAHQRVVRPRVRGRPAIVAVRRDNHLASAAALERHRNSNGDRRAVEFPVLAGDLPFRLHAAFASRDWENVKLLTRCRMAHGVYAGIRRAKIKSALSFVYVAK